MVFNPIFFDKANGENTLNFFATPQKIEKSNFLFANILHVYSDAASANKFNVSSEASKNSSLASLDEVISKFLNLNSEQLTKGVNLEQILSHSEFSQFIEALSELTGINISDKLNLESNKSKVVAIGDSDNFLMFGVKKVKDGLNLKLFTSLKNNPEFENLLKSFVKDIAGNSKELAKIFESTKNQNNKIKIFELRSNLPTQADWDELKDKNIKSNVKRAIEENLIKIIKDSKENKISKDIENITKHLHELGGLASAILDKSNIINSKSYSETVQTVEHLNNIIKEILIDQQKSVGTSSNQFIGNETKQNVFSKISNLTNNLEDVLSNGKIVKVDIEKIGKILSQIKAYLKEIKLSGKSVNNLIISDAIKLQEALSTTEKFDELGNLIEKLNKDLNKLESENIGENNPRVKEIADKMNSVFEKIKKTLAEINQKELKGRAKVPEISNSNNAGVKNKIEVQKNVSVVTKGKEELLDEINKINESKKISGENLAIKEIAKKVNSVFENIKKAIAEINQKELRERANIPEISNTDNEEVKNKIEVQKYVSVVTKGKEELLDEINKINESKKVSGEKLAIKEIAKKVDSVFGKIKKEFVDEKGKIDLSDFHKNTEIKPDKTSEQFISNAKLSTEKNSTQSETFSNIVVDTKNSNQNIQVYIHKIETVVEEIEKAVAKINFSQKKTASRNINKIKKLVDKLRVTESEARDVFVSNKKIGTQKNLNEKFDFSEKEQVSNDGLTDDTRKNSTKEISKNFIGKTFNDFQSGHIREVLKPVVVEKNNLIKRLADFIQKNKKQSIEIQLKPEHLGKVKVALDLINDTIKASIHVETVHAKNLIENNLNELYAQLNRSGVQIANINISTNSNLQKHEKHAHYGTKSGKKLSKINAVENESEINELENQEPRQFGYNTYEYLV